MAQTMNISKNDFLLFYDRPREPCFLRKEAKTIFKLPEEYCPDKYREVMNVVFNKVDENVERVIPVSKITLPNIEELEELPCNSHFSLFMSKHRNLAGKLIDHFLNMPNLEDLISVCAYSQLRLNPYMFNYCLTVALLHRSDTKGLSIPTLVQAFPDKFVDPKVFNRLRTVASLEPDGQRKPVLIPRNFTASDLEPEQRLAYFREDIGINLHHWHWHLVYPPESANREIVAKDRRGELLYYMHQQIIARYNVERFCNDLPRVVPFGTDLREPIKEAYFPKLNSVVASRSWPPRFENSVFQDVDRPVNEIKLEVSEMERWRDRILEAIDSNTILLPDGSRMVLDEEKGIDILGNLMEASSLSVNRTLYGDFHNMGHILASYIHDPDHRHLESYAVMGDTSTTMRDPLFYRWHGYIDDIFVLYKNKLAPYTDDKLDFPGIRVCSVSVEGKAGKNTFATHWEQSTLELGRGMDFFPRGGVLATFTHLQHEELDFLIEVDNSSGEKAMGTVRIFLAPITDENGNKLTFNDQRRLMIELDKFSQDLAPGKNIIRRASIQSSVTIPYERTFQDQTKRPGEKGSITAAEFDFCGCGWPHHMLLPKGTKQGYPMILFVMVSNWADDAVIQDLVGTSKDAASYCGIRDRKYPDKRAMGFPFDRPVPTGVQTVNDFLKPNMAVTDCKILFSDEVRVRGANSSPSSSAKLYPGLDASLPRRLPQCPCRPHPAHCRNLGQVIRPCCRRPTNVASTSPWSPFEYFTAVGPADMWPEERNN